MFLQGCCFCITLYDAPADKQSQISSKRTQRKFTFNLLSAAEIHRIILLRQTLNTSPLRVKTPLVLPKLWQSRIVASYIPLRGYFLRCNTFDEK